MSIEVRGMRIEVRVNSRIAAQYRTSKNLPLAPRSSLLATRHGVTLIELLVTITIIAILSATFLGVTNLAMESAREARTKSTIGKIHGLLMEKWSEYETRRVDIHPTVLSKLREEVNSLPPNLQRRALGEAMADLRLLAVRELMKFEMPDRWTDIGVPLTANTYPSPSVLAATPAITQVYRRIGEQSYLIDANNLQTNQGAECLYMVIMNFTGDGEARTLFSEQDTGDTDGDGAREFLDGWGKPISFIRWPAGFVSPLQPVDPATGNRLADQDHDPFDPFRRHTATITRNLLPPPRYPAQAPGGNIDIRRIIVQMSAGGQFNVGAYRLTPLIYSAGPDDVFDIVSPRPAITGLNPYDAVRQANGDPYVNSNNDALQLGLVNDQDFDGDNSLDNIHNHLQDNR